MSHVDGGLVYIPLASPQAPQTDPEIMTQAARWDVISGG